MARTFSIITTCKGRLEHLKQTLPTMLAQDGAEVIVVDYSCPDSTADYVEANHPSARVVRVEGEEGFSNWKARNRGAAVASGNMLVFCDADTLLANGAIAAIAASVPDTTYGFFSRNSTAHFNRTGLRLGANQLRGFQAVPTEGFRKLGGYDELLEGYAAGGDTDLEDRLRLLGYKAIHLGDGIIEDVVDHDNEARFTFHKAPITTSYAAGLLYRRAKMTLLRIKRRANLPLADRERLYAIARGAAQRLACGEDSPTIQVNIESIPIGMPRQLGYGRGRAVVSIKVQLELDDKIPGPLPG